MKPILMSTPMVRAILQGRKRQTRRVIRLKSKPDLLVYGGRNWRDKDIYEFEGDGYYVERVKSRFQVGDSLYVREGMFKNQEDEYGYMADEPDWKLWEYTGIPSIHMHKAAARIFLRVTNVRVERLWQITEDDALAEGVRRFETKPDATYGYDKSTVFFEFPHYAFQYLWDSINAKRGYPWDSNPFVWVISFERIEKPVG